MTATVKKIVTAATTNLTRIDTTADNPKLKGILAVNTSAAAYFIKVYWFRPTASAAAPTVGTTVPKLTFLVPALGTTTGQTLFDTVDGWIGGDGAMWIAVTQLAGDSDATAVGAGDGIISIVVDP